MARCRARTQDGTLCRNPVKKSGLRCHKHKGMPEAGPRTPKKIAARTRGPATMARARSRTTRTQSQAPRGPDRRWTQQAAWERRRRERVEEAAKVCGDVLTDGWREAVATRATEYVTEPTWQRLFRRRRRHRCKRLAEMASTMLAAKKTLHDVVGSVAGGFVSLLGGDGVTQTFTRELASRIPLPYDAKAVAVARGLQVTGVLLCVANGDDLTRCQCFIDLALAETKTAVKNILIAATGDWTGLADFPPKRFVGPYEGAGGS